MVVIDEGVVVVATEGMEDVFGISVVEEIFVVIAGRAAVVVAGFSVAGVGGSDEVVVVVAAASAVVIVAGVVGIVAPVRKSGRCGAAHS